MSGVRWLAARTSTLAGSAVATLPTVLNAPAGLKWPCTPNDVFFDTPLKRGTRYRFIVFAPDTMTDQQVLISVDAEGFFGLDTQVSATLPSTWDAAKDPRVTSPMLPGQKAWYLEATYIGRTDVKHLVCARAIGCWPGWGTLPCKEPPPGAACPPVPAGGTQDPGLTCNEPLPGVPLTEAEWQLVYNAVDQGFRPGLGEFFGALIFLPVLAVVTPGQPQPQSEAEARKQLATAVVAKLRTCESSLPVDAKRDPDYNLIECWAAWWFRAWTTAKGTTERPDICASIVGPFNWQETCQPKPKDSKIDLNFGGGSGGGLAIALLIGAAAIGLFYATLGIKPGPAPARYANPGARRNTFSGLRSNTLGPRLSLSLENLHLAVVEVIRTDDRAQPFKIWLGNEPYLTTADPEMAVRLAVQLAEDLVNQGSYQRAAVRVAGREVYRAGEARVRRFPPAGV